MLILGLKGPKTIVDFKKDDIPITSRILYPFSYEWGGYFSQGNFFVILILIVNLPHPSDQQQ
jgi:hypothetical protein